ncbi:MAG: shikimate dehydrogenase [Acidobacteria bacterium]|nr:shikimate dehydrogenase [Acidobacteriota bacterium]
MNTKPPAQTVLAGLIGHGIQASRTPRLHEEEGRAQGLTYTYELLDLQTMNADTSALPRLLDETEARGFAGLNITHPCKQAVLPLLDELSVEANAIGAVNTVVFTNGKRIGHNTDWWGFAESFKRGLPDVPREKVALLGAGGAGAALAYAAFQLGVQHLLVYDVSQSRAVQLATHCNQQLAKDWAEPILRPESALATANGCMQATPIGMYGHPGLPISASLLHPNLWVSEVIYTPLETELLRHAKALGCQVLNGSGMTVFQAVKTFTLFTGLPANPERMLRHFSTLMP